MVLGAALSHCLPIFSALWCSTLWPNTYHTIIVLASFGDVGVHAADKHSMGAYPQILGDYMQADCAPMRLRPQIGTLPRLG